MEYRQYITVDGGLISKNAGHDIHLAAIANLRKIWRVTGLDYTPFQVEGQGIYGPTELTIDSVAQRARPQMSKTSTSTLSSTRFIFSQAPLTDPDPPSQHFDLMITISLGNRLEWNGASANRQASVAVREDDYPNQVTCVTVDVLQDIMIAQSPLISTILEKYIADGGTIASFLKSKSDFIKSKVRSGDLTTIFESFNPDAYVSFNAVARTNTYPAFNDKEAMAASHLWDEFLQSHFAEHFLNPEEAASYVRKFGGRRATSEGVEPRTAYGGGSFAELVGILSNPLKVQAPGAYILVVPIGRPKQGQAGAMGSVFGWRTGNEEPRRKPKLFSASDALANEHVTRLVAEGALMPIRLYLKGAA